MAGLALVFAGCMMKPKETGQLDRELQEAGKPYQKPFAQRQLPELPSPAGWPDVLQRAFLANGELEAAYDEWQAAMHRIAISSYWPNSNVSLGFEYMFSGGGAKTWDRVTTSAAFDPSATLKLPVKVRKEGEIALANARQTAQTFAATKFRIQRQVLVTYYDVALMEEQIRLMEQSLELQKLTVQNVRSRVQAGGVGGAGGGAAQQDMLKAQLAARVMENEIATMQSQAKAMRAMLNGVMARPADAPIDLPEKLPDARPIPDDDQLIAMGVDTSPDIKRLAAQVKGRQDAIDLAKMQYLPDISPTAAFTGSVSQSIGAMVMLPTTIPMIEASIKEAQSMREASEAMLRQTRQDKAANFVATLYALRNAERQEKYYRGTILPVTRQVLQAARQDYTAGRMGLGELLDAQRMLIDVNRSIDQFHIDREKRLAELEEIAGMDVEAIKVAATQPTTEPITDNAK